MENKDVHTLSKQEKTIALFEFIKELNKLKQKVVLNIHEYQWFTAISSIPDFPECISMFYRDRVDQENENASDLLLSVKKPEFEKCPTPDRTFADWLRDGWDNYLVKAEVCKELSIEGITSNMNISSAEDDAIESFEDSAERVAAYEDWTLVRDAWANRQCIIEKTRKLFADLYGLYYELQRESETKEFIVANGMLRDVQNPDIVHPVLTHRVELRYDASRNIISIYDTQSAPELYSALFSVMQNVNLETLNQLNDDLHINDYHPLDRIDTPEFLKVLVRQLSHDSIFSDKGVPEGWDKKNRLLLYLEPYYLIRKRLDGTPKAIEKIIENIKQVGFVPAPIIDIVNGGKIDLPEDDKEESIAEQLAAVGGESVDVLLSKEANKEQLEIARRIEKYNAVLVQGPPGTGKTHTIANLMGHFLSQGKRVLVTSHTKKALSVLKEKVAPGLQNLCVSVLDDSNLDMERSVDGITDYMSKTTSYEMKRDMELLAGEREELVEKLADVRRKIFAILNQECNCIVYNGEEISPSKAAEFVRINAEELSYIPGRVRLRVPMPLTFSQLTELYRSNILVSEADEKELLAEIPKPDSIMSPTEFEHIEAEMQAMQNKLDEILQSRGWTINNQSVQNQIEINCEGKQIKISDPKSDTLQELSSFINCFPPIEPWMKTAAVDGKKGGAYRKRWQTLIEEIEKSCHCTDILIAEQFGADIVFKYPEKAADLKPSFEALKNVLAHSGKIPMLTRICHKDYITALESVNINGKQAQSAADCDLVLHVIEQQETRKKCAAYWDELLATQGVPRFFELDDFYPEQVAHNWIAPIHKCLDWYQRDYSTLTEMLDAAGIPCEKVFDIEALDSDLSATSKILPAVEQTIPALCEISSIILALNERKDIFRRAENQLRVGKHTDSNLCKTLADAIADGDVSQYINTFALIEKMYGKYELQHSREEMLNILRPVAHQWADAIQNREGIHGSGTVPDTIEEAWKWKQLSGIIDEITEEPLEQLQTESLQLSKDYRNITAKYAAKCGWYHLLRKTEADIDMKQALQGWKQTVKRIGRGTGKSAPTLKAKARALMAKCQAAVPCWIMPINRALESLNPRENQFDVVIIDEASQSDISSLAILYMGKKLIIVGDDKQVSPMAIGMDIDKMTALQEIYLRDKIPNAHLYDAKTSIYDIAATTFQPLMLREHFRCVPEIIGFSNMLSYDYKIKPLRDASNSKLLPAVVNYRVMDGQRNQKSNQKEAETIVALMRACIEQEEYAGKTFGVISLLGDDQVKVIQREIEQKIDGKEIECRHILCGNSAHFQGDERDVIFLSLVDSSSGNGPLSMMGVGVDDAYRKRYNVAASRAKDQLWVVHSLDAANDLKHGDMRKILIDYAANPQATDVKRIEIEARAESPFESAVALSLVNQGYHIIQQWPVGAYRLDMVAMYGEKKVAIECDGERWHSGEEKVREDMERQTILERLGWRFIRIRGSEYYRAPEDTMKRVISELTALGIEPESDNHSKADKPHTSELLERVKLRAMQILETVPNPEPILPAPEPVVPEPKPATPKPMPALPEPRTESQKPEKGKPKPNEPIQITMPGIDITKVATEMQNEVVAFLKDHDISYIDKRAKGGALWIIGGRELMPLILEAKENGFEFKFKQGGGKATKWKDGWWIK